MAAVEVQRDLKLAMRSMISSATALKALAADRVAGGETFKGQTNLSAAFHRRGKVHETTTRLCGDLHSAVRQKFVQERHQHRSSRLVAIYYQTNSTLGPPSVGLFDRAVESFDDTVD